MKMRKQRYIGLALVLIAVLVWCLASTGRTTEDRDATAVVILLPLGVYALVSKENLLADEDADDPEPEEPAGSTPIPITIIKEGATSWHENAS